MTGPSLKELKRLGELTSVLRDIEMSRLDAKSREVAHLEQRIIGIAKAGVQTEMQDDTHPDAASMASQAARYANWASMETAKLNIDLARARGEREVLLVSARRAFGRDEAIANVKMRLIGTGNRVRS